MAEKTKVMPPRISEDPENYRQVFASTRATVEAVRAGTLEGKEASAMAQNDAIGHRILEADLKARVVEHRMHLKDVAERERVEQATAGAKALERQAAKDTDPATDEKAA